MILLVLMVTPPYIYSQNVDKVILKIYQGVTYTTNKIQKIELRVNISKDALHRSFCLIDFKIALARFIKGNLATKLKKSHNAVTINY